MQKHFSLHLKIENNLKSLQKIQSWALAVPLVCLFFLNKKVATSFKPIPRNKFYPI